MKVGEPSDSPTPLSLLTMTTLFSLPVATLCNLQVTVRLGQTNIEKLSLNLEPISDATPPTSTRIIGEEGESELKRLVRGDADANVAICT